MFKHSPKKVCNEKSEEPQDTKIGATIVQSEVLVSKEKYMQENLEMMTPVKKENKFYQCVNEISNNFQHFSIGREKNIQVEAPSQTNGKSFILILL